MYIKLYQIAKNSTLVPAPIAGIVTEYAPIKIIIYAAPIKTMTKGMLIVYKGLWGECRQ